MYKIGISAAYFTTTDAPQLCYRSTCIAAYSTYITREALIKMRAYALGYAYVSIVYLDHPHPVMDSTFRKHQGATPHDNKLLGSSNAICVWTSHFLEMRLVMRRLRGSLVTKTTGSTECCSDIARLLL